MLDTLMALWNRGYAGKGLKFLLPFLLIGLCLFLFLATEFIPAHTLSANGEHDVEEAMSSATPTQIISWSDEQHVIIILTPPQPTPTEEVAPPPISQIINSLPQLPPPTLPIPQKKPGKAKVTPTPARPVPTHPVQKPTPTVMPEPTEVVQLPPPQPTIIVLLTPTSTPSPITMPPIDAEDQDGSIEESE